MKLYKCEVDIKSTFLTYPKGDMLFGFLFYWNEKLKKGFELIKDNKSKIVFSDFLPKNHLPKPSLPINYFVENEEELELKRKVIKSISWIKEEKLKKGDLNLDEGDKIEFIKTFNSVKNHLNKLTFTTDEGFTPFSIREIEFLYPVEIYIASDIDIDRVVNFINEIGEIGFGRKSSIGKGRFEIVKKKEVKLNKGASYVALSPFITKKRSFYNTFSRFGKYHYNKKPFKKPVVLMDRGTVVFEECGLVEGEIIDNSLVKESILNAYSIMIPLNIRKKDEN